MFQASKDVFSFDPVKGDWKVEKPLLYGRCDLGVAVLDGLLYAVGGSDGTSGTWRHRSNEVGALM